jgi:hypothetical protein
MGGVFEANVVRKLMSFGANDVNDFRGCEMVLLIKLKISLTPTWKTFTTWHIAPI